MTQIDATTSTAAAVTTKTTASETSGSALSSDFDTFLKMLTAQMQNQDPLNPIESADFAVQLATFSNVEQQVQTNDLLNRLIDQSGMQTMSQMSGWIGQEVRVASKADYEGAPVTISPAPVSTANTAELVIRNVSGQVINRFGIPVSDAPVEWDGKTSGGDPAPWGAYSFEVNSYDGEGALLQSSTPEIYAEVTEARLSNQGVDLVLKGGTMVASDLVTAIRAGK